MTSRSEWPTPPVLLLAYRRPDLVAEVMKVIAQAKPQELFLACDGPHPDRPDEVALVTETRSAMEAAITWDCEVKTRYSDTNQGCRRSVEGAISWFFQHVEEGVVLEDDCVPHPDFFPYCAELLNRFRNDARVMHISGDAALPHPASQSGDSYVFTAEGLVWGWATWRRAWQLYDSDLRQWERLRLSSSEARELFGSASAARWWSRILDRLLLEGRPDSWAYRWSFTLIANRGLCIIPAVNLVSNIGFREDSTHNFNPGSPRANGAVQPILPLRHPAEVVIDRRSDSLFQRQLRGFARDPATHAMRKVRKFSRRLINRLRGAIAVRLSAAVPFRRREI